QPSTGAARPPAPSKHVPCHSQGGGHGKDGRRVAESYWHQRLHHDRHARTMQPERDRKKPSHGWVESMKCPQPDEDQPRPRLGHSFLAIEAPRAQTPILARLGFKWMASRHG